MALSVEQINTKASKFTIAGWFAGLAYFNWFSSTAVHVSWVGHAILVIVGMFAASIIIGMGVALIMGLITKIATGRTDGSPHVYAWGAFISPVIAFFAAEPTIRLVARYT
jgi:large-conductance mechanosensitive channel